MNTLAVRAWILFAALLALLYGGWIWARAARESDQPQSTSLSSWNVESHSTPAVEPQRTVADFSLTDQTGQPFGSAELRGKVWIASFFFASCPATCRQLNQGLAGVLAATPADVMVVSLTCDPETDTPETLARYGEIFHADAARWKFLTGPMADLRRVGRDIFQVAFEKGVHSERVFVVDREGRIRGRYSVLASGSVDKTQVDKLIAFVRGLAAETPTTAAPDASQPAPDETPPAEPADTSPPAAQ